MSARVGVCSREEKTINMIGLTQAMGARVVEQMYFSFLNYSQIFNALRIQVCLRQWGYVCNSGVCPLAGKPIKCLTHVIT